MYGVVDIGSNTIRLVIYRYEDGKLTRMLNKKYTAGLAGYVNKDNELTKAGIQVAIDSLNDIKLLLESIRLEQLFVFATASLRNIINTEEAVQAITEATGYSIRVLTGEEEAMFDYYGILLDNPKPDGLAVDSGGGSTELIFFHTHKIVHAQSLPIGSLNLYREYIGDLLPRPGETKAIRKEVRKRLKKISLPDDIDLSTAYWVGGSGRAVSKLLRAKYGVPDESRTYEKEYLDKLVEKYGKSREKFADLILRSAPERIHTVVPGMYVMEEILTYYDTKEIVSVQNSVREGYLWTQLKELGVII